MTGIQPRLILFVLAIVGVVLAVSAGVAQRGLDARELDQLQARLEADSRLAASALGSYAELARQAAERRHVLVSERAAEAGTRVTVIAPDGRVIADSEVPPRALDQVENYADRPEIRAALRGDLGSDRRSSRSLGTEQLYLARPYGPGVLRLSVGLEDLQRAQADLQHVLGVAAAVSLLAVCALAFWLWRVLGRPLERTRRALAAAERGDLGARTWLRGSGEIGRIGASLDHLLDRIQQRLAGLERENEHYHAVLGGMAEGVLVVGADGRVVLANPRLRQLFGLTEDVEGTLPIELIRSAELQDAIDQALKGDAQPEVFELTTPPPSRRQIQVGTAGFPMADGRGAVVAFHDVSDVRHLEAVRRDFVANASHELRTPLAAIRGFAETLAQDDLDPEQRRHFVEIVGQHAQRLSALVDDLLDLSRAESGSAPLQPRDLELGEVVRAVVSRLEPRFQQASVTVRIASEGPVRAQADPDALEQILVNLLDNAAKYGDHGSEVRIRLEDTGRGAAIEVEDEGIGIPESDQARVFERFYRVDRARSRALGGTGLGLSIVRHLVRASGGEITLRSRLGSGSTFRFTLPPPGDGSATGA